MKRATITYPLSVLMLPEGVEPTGAKIDDGNLVISVDTGRDRFATVHRTEYRGDVVQHVEIYDVEPSPEEDK